MEFLYEAQIIVSPYYLKKIYSRMLFGFFFSKICRTTVPGPRVCSEQVFVLFFIQTLDAMIHINKATNKPKIKLVTYKNV